MSIKINNGFEKAVISYNPAKYKTKAGAAKGLHKALMSYANKKGLDTSGLFIKSPDESKLCNGYKAWWVCWEGFIYDWAIGASFQVTGKWGYTEPYYGFDLHFVS